MWLFLATRKPEVETGRRKTENEEDERMNERSQKEERERRPTITAVHEIPGFSVNFWDFYLCVCVRVCLLQIISWQNSWLGFRDWDRDWI